MKSFKSYQKDLQENLIKQALDNVKTTKASMKQLVKSYKDKLDDNMTQAIHAYTDHDDTSIDVNAGIRGSETGNPFQPDSIAHHITRAIAAVPHLPHGTTLWYGTQSDPSTKHPKSNSFTPNRLVSTSLNPKTAQSFATETTGSSAGSYLLSNHSKVKINKLTPDELASGQHTTEISGDKAKHIEDYNSLFEKTPEEYSKLRERVPELQDHHFIHEFNKQFIESKHVVPVAHLVKLTVDGDQPGISVNHLSTNPGEDEVILPHNSVFEKSANSEFSHVGRDFDGQPTAIRVHHYKYTGTK